MIGFSTFMIPVTKKSKISAQLYTSFSIGSNDSGIMVSRRKKKRNGIVYISMNLICLRRDKCLRATRTLEDLLGTAYDQRID